MEEIWKNILGFENNYQVSNLGRFRSKDNIVHTSDGRSYFKAGIILKPLKYSNGYNQLMLYMNKKRYTFIAHRIVANTFIPNIYNKKEVNHINGIKDDNRVENLEWCSPSENIQKALLFNPNFGKNRGKNNKRLTEKDVIEIKKMMIDGLKNNEILSKYKISKTSFFNIKSNKTWSHVHIINNKYTTL